MLKEFLPASFKDRFRWKWWALRHWLLRPACPKNSDGSVNIHLGCGKVNHPAFINVDAMPWPHVHYVSHVERLPMFSDDVADLIYVCHCLEHVSFLDVPSVLLEWRRVLKPGGTLRISVPDFDRILTIYEENARTVESIELTLLGGQNYAFNFHKSLYNPSRLTTLLEGAGFTDVAQWTPGATPLTTFNDWSGKPVVVGDKRYPISLNLEARKTAD